MKIANILGKKGRFWHKSRAGKVGFLGETFALLYLIARGYLPLRYNAKGRAQVDIIARKGQNLWLIEVKTRKNWQAQERALSFAQKQRLTREVTQFQRKYPSHKVALATVRVCPAWPFIKLEKLRNF